MSTRPEDLDIRTLLKRQAYYTPIPEVVLVYMARHGLCATVIALWGLYWGEGVRNGTWLAEMSVEDVAERLGKKACTIERAHRCLIELGLIRRLRRRNPRDPREECVAITEVLIPQAVTECFATERKRSPARCIGSSAPHETLSVKKQPTTAPLVAEAWEEFRELEKVKWNSLIPLREKLDRSECLAWTLARGQRDPAAMQFSPHTRLTSVERASIIAALEWSRDNVPSEQPMLYNPLGNPATFERSKTKRRLTRYQYLDLGKRLQPYVSAATLSQRVEECAWSVLHGCFSTKPIPWAINAAVKTVRERGETWTRPYSMPVGWTWERGGA